MISPTPSTTVTQRPWFRFLVATAILALPILIASSFGNSSEEHHAEAGLPTVVLLQFINFFLYVSLVVYFARKPIIDYFKGRQTKFYIALKRADNARAEAQAKMSETKARLAELETSRDESIRHARAEAAALRTQIVEEAKSLSIRLRADAEQTAQVEIERAKMSLREDLINQSVAMAHRILSDKMLEPDQKRLQEEFVTKIATAKDGPVDSKGAVTL